MKKFNLSLLLACLAGGLIGSFLAGWIYSEKLHEWNPIVLTGIYFSILSFSIYLPGVISEWITNHLRGRMWDSSETMTALWMLPVGTFVLFFILGALFQFIYGLGTTKTVSVDTDDYIIMIDNSGSTFESDPDNQRFSSIVEFINSMKPDKKVMVTVFDSVNQVVLPLTDQPAAASQIQGILNRYTANGGTDIQGALLNSLDTYKQANSGRRAMAILLSDGVSYVDMNTISDTFGDAGIPIFTIGFANMDSDGRRILSSIAEGTGGAFFEISELSQLTQALNQVMNFKSKRMLLEYRSGTERGSMLYTILRVVFLTALGITIGIPLIFILDSQELILPAMPIRAGASLLAAVLMEFGLRQFWSTGLLKTLMCLLFALVVCFYNEMIRKEWTSGIGGFSSKGSTNTFADGSGTGNRKQGFNEGNSFDDWNRGTKGGGSTSGGYRSNNNGKGNTFRKF